MGRDKILSNPNIEEIGFPGISKLLVQKERKERKWR